MKLALISFWQKLGQNGPNGGHLKKKNQFLNLKLRNRKRYSETDEIWGSQELSMITAKHFSTFQKFQKISKFAGLPHANL